MRLETLTRYERQLQSNGFEYVAGVDESGMGPLAGPVVAAAVILPPGKPIPGINDSKRLSANQREILAEQILEAAIHAGIGIASVNEIDTINIYQAGLLAMRRAVTALSIKADHILVDARTIPGINIPQTAFTKGDTNHYCIAAASILAKTHRDKLMQELASRYPHYGFNRHKGYGTPEHCRAIQTYGASPVHRISYSIFEKLLNTSPAKNT